MERRKVLLAVILILSILLQSVLPLTVVNAASNVNIILPDSNLYAAVKSQLSENNISASYKDANNTIVISSTELEKVISLNLSNSEIEDLTGLDAFTSLKDLNLTANDLTIDSNLSILSNLSNLEKLNLSSNKIASIKSISNFSNIKNTDITNQELEGKDIITVDTTEESDQATTVTISLPDILLEDTGMIEADWIEAYIDGEASVKWTSMKPGSTDLVLDVAQNVTVTETNLETGEDEQVTKFEAKKGLITITVHVKNSDSKLANTRLTYYYAVIDSDQTGIIFKDENLYKAVKDQLTAGQIENSELSSYRTNGTTLYDEAYDEALILVINTDTLINKIPSLYLNDKRIKDLTGLEYFVGLKSTLDVSYNYIESIEKIIELAENKVGKEQEIQEKYELYLGRLSTIREKVKVLRDEIESLNEQIANSEANNKDELYKQLATAQTKLSRYYELETKALQKLYNVYNDEYKLTALLPYEINILSKEEIDTASLSTLKSYVSQIIQRISSLEEAEAIDANELEMFIEVFGVETTMEVTTESGDTKTVDVENPIKTYFETFQEGEDFYTINDYKNLMEKFKYINVADQLYNYCLTQRRRI